MVSGQRLEGDATSRQKRRKSEDFLRRASGLFLREAPARVEELWSAGKSKQLARVAVAAHTLGCLAENLDADPLIALAKAVETAASGDNLSIAQLPEILYELEIAYAELAAGLQRAQEKGAS
jgi:HPt (histidine-containing phosphotransfer) domain-containing protein